MGEKQILCDVLHHLFHNYLLFIYVNIQNHVQKSRTTESENPPSILKHLPVPKFFATLSSTLSNQPVSHNMKYYITHAQITTKKYTPWAAMLEWDYFVSITNPLWVILEQGHHIRACMSDNQLYKKWYRISLCLDMSSLLSLIRSVNTLFSTYRLLLHHRSIEL